MNTLPASVQEQVREYDEFAHTYFVTEDTLTRVHEITPTGEEVVSYIQRITSPPSMGFIEFVEKDFLPKTPFTKKLFILRVGCSSCKKPWVWMAKEAYRYACIGEAEEIEYDNNPREDGTVDGEIHYDEQNPKRKTRYEKIADERYKRLMEALGQAEANLPADGL